jgi:polysaccharide export outer membrane protein
LAVCGFFAVASCATLPRDAPTSEAVRDAAALTVGRSDAPVPYALVKLSAANVTAINGARPDESSNLSALARPGAGTRDVVLGVGDVLNVSVFESAAGGLFVPAEAGTRTGNFVQMPNQQIDASGAIDVPYAGEMHIAGLTARQAGEEISKRLAKRALEPQTVVSIVDRRGEDVSVLGDVGSPARFALDPGGLRLIDAIARAGGNRDPDYETVVTIQRRGRDYGARLSAILADPARNVPLQSGDVVYLAHHPRFFMEFGATGDAAGATGRRVTFEDDSMTLAEGLAKGGGLRDDRADASAVFVFRIEPAALPRSLGADVGSFVHDVVPTVYSVDLNSPDGVFLMSRFQLSDRDVVVVSNAASIEFLKFLNVLTQTSVASYNFAVARYNLAH